MAEPIPTTASSLAVALRLKPDFLLQAGSGLRLTSAASASALARSVAGDGSGLDPTAALARAAGLGVGSSRFYSKGSDPAVFDSPNLTILSGGGLVDGVVKAEANSTGSGPTSAEALATNIGLANLTYLARTGQPLQIGTTFNPLAAKATARTDVLLPAAAVQAGLAPPPNTALRALATVRGLEGSPPAEVAPQLDGGIKSLPRFYGQPDAVVEASSGLTFDNPSSATAAAASADAVGLEGYQIFAVPADPSSLDIAAQIGGDATARLNLTGRPDSLTSLELAARAVGVESSVISGVFGRDTLLKGRGFAEFSGDLPNAASINSASTSLASLLGIGIANSTFFGADGIDTVLAQGGTKGPKTLNNGSADLAATVAATVADTVAADAAGLHRSLIHTGAGNDIVYGAVFADQLHGFDGIRQSTVRTGEGQDLIAGSSNTSVLDGGDDADEILLDRSVASALRGGRGDDALTISGVAATNVLWGGDGNDTLLLANGADPAAGPTSSGGNVLDGGYGHDRIAGLSGNDLYVQSMAGAALQAARSGFDTLLTDAAFWASLGDGQRQEIWQHGRFGGEAIVDSFESFSAGLGGDRLELNSSLAGIRQDLWESDGALYRANNGALEVIEGRGSESIGMVLGTLAEIQKLGMGAPSMAYATDTRQLMFDADTDWSRGSISLGSLNVGNPAALRLDNFAFGATDGAALGPAGAL